MINQHDDLDEDMAYVRDLTKNAMTIRYPTAVRVRLKGDSSTGEHWAYLFS